MSSLGNSLYNARKSKGLTQEEVAEKLGVSRQTISKWELDETLPDIRQAKSLAQLYHTTLDDLLQYDAQVEEIQRVIRHTSEETQQKVDWTKLWGEMYPVLTTYPQQVDIPRYTAPLAALLQDLESTYHYTPLDAFLVLKDILGKMWTEQPKSICRARGKAWRKSARNFRSPERSAKKQGREWESSSLLC